MTRVAYLGPRGTFCEAALLTMPTLADADHEPATSVQAAIDAVRAGAADSALIPIENSVEGSVSVTLDELASGKRLVIVDEVALPVRFALLARPGTTMADVNRLMKQFEDTRKMMKAVAGGGMKMPKMPGMRR